jgi:hypothetical protein
LKKTNYILSITFLLLSCNLWATEVTKDSIKGFYIANPDAIFVKENTLSINNKLVNTITQELIVFESNRPQNLETPKRKTL